MDKELVATSLPERPREGMDQWVWGTFQSLLGGEKILFHRERVTLPPDFTELLTGEMDERRRRRWAAQCTCTACEEEFIAGWVSYTAAGVKGIRVYMGEDALYPGYVEPEEPMSVEIAAGEQFVCPYCETLADLQYEGDVKNGCTYQLMIGSVETVDRYTAVVTWIYRRYLDPGGIWLESVHPAEAVVIDERGRLCRFSHIIKTYGITGNRGRWVPLSTMDDIFMTTYHNYDANNHRQVGGDMWKSIPDLAGSTGEKTGLADYVLAGGVWPIAYLRIWQKNRKIENLMKSPWGRKVEADIGKQIDTHLAYGRRSGKAEIGWADLLQAKPHKQLGMTRSEMHALVSQWGLEQVEEWAVYRQHGARVTATEFDGFLKTLGLAAVRRLVAYELDSGDDEALVKGARYLQKQKELTAGQAADMLVDLWDMLDEAEAEGRTVTAEMRWPRNLQEAHDRESENRAIRKKKENAKKYAEGFRAILDKYGALEWTDGELCVRLPRDNGELIAEGDTLRHCVGGYGAGHIEERTVVFFVRHYRRPERSYYTMDYSFRHSNPRRAQLHGYGNERHGQHKEHSHKIPQKVKDFCARWEREVLMPWWCEQQSEKTETTKRSA